MKKNNRLLIGLLTLFLAFAMSSCEEDDYESPNVEVGNFDVTSAFPGDPVSITGTNFSTIQFVFVGDQQAEFQLNGDTLTFNVPDNSTIGANTITFAMADNYRVTAPFEVILRPIPVVERFNAFVPVGEDLVMTGLSLNAEYSPVVTIDGVEASIVSNSPTELVVTVPNSVPDDKPLKIVISSIHGETTVSTAFIARENILANSELYDGSGDSFDSWEILNPGNGILELTGEEAYGEGRSMRILPTGGNPWDTQLASAPVQLEFEAEYTVVFWAKADEAGAHMRISASQFDGNGADYFYSHGNDETGIEISELAWLPYSVTFTVGNDLPEHKIVFDMGKGSIPFAIDHMALISGAFGAGGEAPSVLAEGDFETDLSAWTILNGAFEIATSEAYCGSQSLTATSAGANPWDVQLASEELDLTDGTMYELGFWAKAVGESTEENPTAMRASVSRFASGQSDDFFYTPTIEVAEDWTYYGFVFEAQPTSTGMDQLILDFGGNTHTFFVDAISLREYSAPLSLYANGDFEDGINSWEVLNGTLEASTDAYEGEGSLTTTSVGANPWDVQLASEEVALEVDSDYKLSFWAKAPGATDEDPAEMRASVSRFASGQSDDFFYTPTVQVATDWTFYSYVFTAGATSTGVHQIILDFGGNTHTFFVDNVNLSPYTDPCN